MAVRYLERALDMIAIFALVAIIIATPLIFGMCVASIPPTLWGIATLTAVGIPVLGLTCVVWAWAFHQLSRVLNEHAVANGIAKVKGDQWMRCHGYINCNGYYVYTD